MFTIRNRIMAALLIIASSLLPGVYADCDWEDGELNIDIEDVCGDHDDCDSCGDFFFDFWSDD